MPERSAVKMAANARFQARRIAGARHERTLFAVACKPLLGKGLASQDRQDGAFASAPGLSLSPPSGVWLKFTRHWYKDALQERLLVRCLVEKTETLEALYNVKGIPACHLHSGKEVEGRHGPLVIREA